MSVPSVLQGGVRKLSDIGDSKLVALVRERLTDAGRSDVRVSCGDMWYQVWPESARTPAQGWKLHLSATPDSAADVLDRTLPVLLAAGCPFKFAATPDRVRMLNSPRYPRGAAGKFLTVYPDDDDWLLSLARALHEATVGLAGPRVLSDRLYRTGGVVHYRYGGFADMRLLTDDAEYVGALVGPDGALVPDHRDPWFSAPPWITDPFADDGPQANGTGEPAPSAVLLGGRFAAREAIRQSNRGGVYRGVEVPGGAPVVMKQARLHVVGNSGRDAQQGLWHEAWVLDALAPTGVVAARLAVFEQDGDVFLAQEELAGVPLLRWARERAGATGPGVTRRPGVPPDEWTDMAARLVTLLDTVHRSGWVLRDFTPTNVMVDPAGRLKLVDLEFAADEGDEPIEAGTPGYAAPEQLDGAAPRPSADLFSLGAIMFMLATGIDPVFADDRPAGRGQPERMQIWLDRLRPDGDTVRLATPLIMGLTDPVPERRWSLDRARTFLTGQDTGVSAKPPPSDAVDEHESITGAGLDRLLDDGLDHLCGEFTAQAVRRPWPASCIAGHTDPVNVHHGAAGVLAVLARAARHHPRERVFDVLRASCERVEQHLVAESRVLPGLYYGRSGTAWALWDAAEVLDDPALGERAAELAGRVPLEWPNPDVTHGAAGAALTQLYFWRATGDSRFGDRLTACAERLVDRAVCADGRVTWPIPETFASRLAGLTHHGFAHGTAGIGCVLLAAGEAAHRPDWVELAERAGDGLLRAAVVDGDAALWPAQETDRSSPMEHWCSGSAGVGTFLTRLWTATGRTRFRDHAELAAGGVWHRRWYASTAACHGLAGGGDLLLDLAAATGDSRYHRQARDLASLAHAKHAVRDGRLLVPDETNRGFAVDYGNGMSGVVSFFLRLRHGLPRLWMVDGALHPPQHDNGTEPAGGDGAGEAEGDPTEGSRSS